MRRREFITGLGSTVVTPLLASGQEPGRIYRLGVLNAQGRQAPHFAPLFDELRQAGFIEGQNLIVEALGFSARSEQFADIAVQLVNSRVDAILCGGPTATRAAQKATHTIPIIANLDDMVAAGIVPSLARPGGNTTGISFLATELDGKRQEILTELAPGARRIAAIADSNSTAAQHFERLKDAARGRGIDLSIHIVSRPEGIISALDEAKHSGAEALNVLASPVLNAQRRFIFERAGSLRLPAIYQWPENAEEGGLAGYGPTLTSVYRQIAHQLVKVFRGVKPIDLPVEQPINFELAINMKAAKAIGLTVSPMLLNRADQVIE